MSDSILSILTEPISRLNNKLIKFIKSNQKKVLNLEKTNYGLGLHHLRLHNINDAIFRFYIVTLLNDKNADAFFNLAKCYFIKQKKHKVKTYITKCLKANPNHQECLFLKNIIYKSNDLERVPLSLIEELYDKISDEYDREFSYDNGYVAPEDLALEVFHHKKNAKKIVDLGCGTGAAGYFLKKNYPSSEIIGVDISINMLQEAQSRKINKNAIYSKLVHNDIKTFIEKTKENFDIYAASLSLHFEKDISENIKLLEKKMKRGSVLALSVEENLSDNKPIRLNTSFDNFTFKKSHLKKELEKCDLKILSLISTVIKNDKTALILICEK